MFAILLSEGMDPFYQNISSYPTAIFTFLLLLCLLFWLAAVLGVIDIDILDVDLPELAAEPRDLVNPNALAGLLLRFGLQGVPVVIIISLVSLFGWLISYYSVHFLSPLVADGIIAFLVGSAILVAALYMATMITSLIVRPLRPLFKKAQQGAPKQLLGQKAVVRTSVVRNDFGEAVLDDGGAGLILKVRSTGAEEFSRGDHVVLLEYLETENAYRVISEGEFMN